MADKDGFDRLGDEFDQAGRMTATFERELSRLQATMGDTGREIGSLTTGFGSGLRRAFDGVVFDGMRLQDALKGIARNMADAVFAVACRARSRGRWRRRWAARSVRRSPSRRAARSRRGASRPSRVAGS